MVFFFPWFTPELDLFDGSRSLGLGLVLRQGLISQQTRLNWTHNARVCVGTSRRDGCFGWVWQQRRGRGCDWDAGWGYRGLSANSLEVYHGWLWDVWVCMQAKRDEPEEKRGTTHSHSHRSCSHPPDENQQPTEPPPAPSNTQPPSQSQSQSPEPTPSSPYSTTRTLLHDLTRPQVPNTLIPPSPPGTPPPSVTHKFTQFLDIKHHRNLHFNDRIGTSPAARNPALMDRLMDFVGLDERAQYATTLPAGMWDPGAFPDWAFRGELRPAQDKLRKERGAARAGRTAVEFVPAGAGDGGGL